MATNYPARIDTASNLPLVADNATSIKAAVINDLRNAIVAVETELGVKPSGIYGTVRARLDAMDSTFIRIAGDIGGTTANPLVIGIQGRPVSSNAPNVGEALLWSGSAWVPHGVFISGGGSGVIFSGDLSGNDLIQSVTGLHGRPLSGTAPAVGQSIVWNGTAWAPGNTQDVTFAGDLTGTQSSQTVVKLQGRSVLSTAPTTNQILEWNGSAWAPTTLTYGGDLSGNITSQTVTGLQARPVSPSAPTIGQTLVWGGSSWAPSSTVDVITDVVAPVSNANYAVVAANLSTLVAMSGLSTNRTVTLPASPTTGQKVVVKDTDGSLATHNIIVAGNGHNIDNGSSYTLSNIQGPYSSLSVQYNGSIWSII